MLKRVIDDLDQSEYDRDLDDGGKTADAGVVALALEQLILFFRDAVLISGIEFFDLVHFRLETDHFDGIFLHHQGYRQQNELGNQCEEDDGCSIVLHDIVAEIHDPSQWFSQYGVDDFQNAVLAFSMQSRS